MDVDSITSEIRSMANVVSAVELSIFAPRKAINQTGWVLINISCGIGLAYFSIYVLLNTYNSLN